MSKMQGILLPSDPLNDRVVDPAFKVDAEAARWADIPVTLFDSYTLNGDDGVSFRRLPEDGGELFYRGWMLTEAEYTALFEALKNRNINLLTTPEKYVAAHHLPGWYDIFADLTPKSVVLPSNPDRDTITAYGEKLGAESFVVKDFVKSRKHEWDTACYAANVDALPAVVDEFIRLQEEYLVGSVVVREFVSLNKSEGEFRVWWANFKPVLITIHPDDVGVSSTLPEIVLSEELFSAVQELGNPFVTTDLALGVDGEWVVIEVGDGQVSGFPDGVDDDAVQNLFVAVLMHQ